MKKTQENNSLVSDTIIIYGLEIKKEWMDEADFPEHPEFPDIDNFYQWEDYRERMVSFFNKMIGMQTRRVLFN